MYKRQFLSPVQSASEGMAGPVKQDGQSVMPPAHSLNRTHFFGLVSSGDGFSFSKNVK